MLKIGIRAHDLGKGSLEDLINRCKQEKIYNLQFVLAKVIENENGMLDDAKAKLYYDEFTKNDISVAMLGAYFNPIHSNKQKVEDSIIKFKNHLKYAKQLNCKYVGSETGSKNDDKWTYHPLNQSEESYQEVLRIFKDLAAYAEEQDVYTCIEGAFHHVINTPKQLKKLVDEINSDNVRVIVDLYNYLSIDNHENRYEIFKEALELLKDKIVLFHLKDYIVENDKLKQVSLGEGLMDYSKLIPMIKEHISDAYLIFEGITGDGIKSSLELIGDLVYGNE